MSSATEKEIAIVGGGIAGLALALNLHARGLPCRVYEAVPEIREIGVGITLLPHAMRELSQLGLADELAAQGIENSTSAFYNRFGQLLLSEPRGVHAGYPFREVGINRGKLHTTLARAVMSRLGADAIATGRRCVGFEQDEAGVTLRCETPAGDRIDVRAPAVVACDGVNSAIRRHFYPDEQIVFSGVNTWRGVTPHKPILDGRTYLRIGSFHTGNIIVYPIADLEDGRQLVNWVAQIPASAADKNDWNTVAEAADFVDFFKDWIFDWLDIPALIVGADPILEYPMVDKDPIPQWTFGRITFAGDAAHPMYPRGSNGAAQALLDVRTLADILAEGGEANDAFLKYESVRRPATKKVVEANRNEPPDYVNIVVEQLTGDRPFENLDDFISQDELRALSEKYKRVTGYSLDDLSKPSDRQ